MNKESILKEIENKGIEFVEVLSKLKEADELTMNEDDIFNLQVLKNYIDNIYGTVFKVQSFNSEVSNLKAQFDILDKKTEKTIVACRGWFNCKESDRDKSSYKLLMQNIHGVK